MTKFVYRKDYPEVSEEAFCASANRTDFLSQLILKGFFIYKSTLDSDKKIYEEFIERYPNHPYVEQAKGMIQLLYFSDEEIIQKFKN